MYAAIIIESADGSLHACPSITCSVSIGKLNTFPRLIHLARASHKAVFISLSVRDPINAWRTMQSVIKSKFMYPIAGNFVGKNIVLPTKM